MISRISIDRQEDAPIIDDEEPVDPITRKLVASLVDTTEETPDVVETLINTHQLMSEKHSRYTKRYKNKAYAIL